MLAMLVVQLAGCTEQPPEHHYSVLSGKVISCDAEIGELHVEVTGAANRKSKPDRIHCVVTQDSEVYVNDRFTTLREVHVGDAVELIGYREPDRRLESFVVGFAYFRQPLAPAVVPAIFADQPPTTSSAPAEPAQ